MFSLFDGVILQNQCILKIEPRIHSRFSITKIRRCYPISKKQRRLKLDRAMGTKINGYFYGFFPSLQLHNLFAVVLIRFCALLWNFRGKKKTCHSTVANGYNI